MLREKSLNGAVSGVTLSAAKGPESDVPALLPVYAPMPVRPVRGHGSWLVDADGHEWLDAYGGHAVASTGHSHPDVVRAIAEQAAQLLF
jgi:acetylornithine/N-succinyldiaminopimelate aminotransferase